MTRGNKSTEFKVIQGGIVDAVEPPRGLPKDAHDDWNTVTADLASRRLLSEGMLGVVSVYCAALWQVRECTKAIEQHGMFIVGKDGIPKANRAVPLMQRAQETVNRLSVELGLTPSSRSKESGGRTDENPSHGINDFV